MDQDFAVAFPTGAALEEECSRWTKTEGCTRFAAFEGCCGAGDGTLIPVYFRDGKKGGFDPGAYRTRKGSVPASDGEDVKGGEGGRRWDMEGFGQSRSCLELAATKRTRPF